MYNRENKSATSYHNTVSLKAKVKGKNRKRKKSTMVGGACATVMPNWMLSGKGGLRECRGCGSDEEPCGLEDESIVKNENGDYVTCARV